MKYGIDWESRPYEEFDVGSEWRKVEGGFMRCLVSSNSYSALEIILHPNATYDFHLHPDADEEFYVLEGHMEITVLKKVHNIRAGEVFKVRAGILHKTYHPYGMRGIITLRKTLKTDDQKQKVEVIETLLKMKEEERDAPPPAE